MDDMYEYEVVQFSIPLGKVPLQSLSDGSERLFGVWCYLYQRMKKPSPEPLNESLSCLSPIILPCLTNRPNHGILPLG